MVTPTITLRVRPEQQELVRRTVVRLKADPAFADALAALLGDAGAPVRQAVGQRDTADGNVLRRLAWLEMTARITETATDGHGAAIGKLWGTLDSALARVVALERGAAGAPDQGKTAARKR